MDPVGKALWFVESRLSGAVSLETIAAAAGVSHTHLCRAFGAVTGRSVMRYVRERRLSEAAKVLAEGAPDILTVALDGGYGSHEAFTRAFRDQFGKTPEQVRAARSLTGLTLVEPFIMATDTMPALAAPRFETDRPRLIAGIAGRFTYDTTALIPPLWPRLDAHVGHIPGRLGDDFYGVSYDMDEGGGFSYMAGVEVAATADLPADFAHLRLPAQRYAVFVHSGHISTISSTHRAIWNDWLPASGHVAGNGPCFELYDARFDGATGMGPVEIWIPLAA